MNRRPLPIQEDEHEKFVRIYERTGSFMDALDFIIRQREEHIIYLPATLPGSPATVPASNQEGRRRAQRTRQGRSGRWRTVGPERS